MDSDGQNQSHSPERPSTAHRVIRRVPGSFDDEPISPVKPSYYDNITDSYSNDTSDNNLQNVTSSTPTGAPPASAATALQNIPPLRPPPAAESSYLESPSFDSRQSDSQAELAVREHLQDFESSFAAPPSPIPILNNGADDTCLFDSPSKKPAAKASSQQIQKQQTIMESLEESEVPDLSLSQGEGYSQLSQQPLPEIRTETHPADTTNATSSLEAFSSSPTAAAAARTVSRALSKAGAGDADADAEGGHDGGLSAEDSALISDHGSMSAPSQPESVSGEHAGPGLRHMASDQSLRRWSTDAGSTPGHALKVSKQRPKYLRSRNASQRSSVSSFATDPDSDVTVGLGVDYALQSGGALPALGMSRSVSNILSRSVSMGSMASGIEDFHDTSNQSFGHLETLDETDRNMSPHRPNGKENDEDLLKTPKAKRPSAGLIAPTDTVLARHVRNVQVPESLAREYKSKGGLITPNKPTSDFRSGLPGTATSTRHGKNLTLKEQSSTIEKLSKENFDLKLKVMFLSDRLDKLSEEGVKEMISENVELKVKVAMLTKDNKALRKRAKDLEKQLKDEEDRPGTARSTRSDDEQSAAYDQEAQEREEELLYLREQMEEYVTEIERLRAENLQKEAEKRRMAEVVKTMGERVGERVGENFERQEEADVWKDLLEQETARREQGDDDNRRLREENFRLKQEVSAAGTGSAVGGVGPGGGMHHTTNIYNITKKGRDQPISPTRPMTAFSSEMDVNGTSTTSGTLVEEVRRENEQLRHENAELRREVGAQTSMLTSRNREKERLYQEIEDLKMAQRRGGPAPSTVDSILERSASRAGAHERSQSRASGGTRATGTVAMDDAEREEVEGKLSELRDKNNELKLQNQDLQRELDACMEDFEKAIEAKKQTEEWAAQLQEDLDTAMNDLIALQAERDEALQEHANLEGEFEALRKEAQEEIDALEGEADQRTGEIERLQLELNDRTENFDALQEEMRKFSDAVVRLEDEQENKLRRIQQLEQDLADANKELEDLEAKLLESNDKAHRLAVQQESSQGEIAFLREEQEGDKMRIGDLEAALANAEQSLREEKDRARELEQRLAAERRQREIVAGREKEEVQQFVNELNREASAAKDEARRLRKSLTSREVEATEWKERLIELENNLREALGDLNGTRSSILKSIAKLQRDLENTVRELDAAKAAAMEKDRIIKQRDALLESHGLESRKLAEMLDKERQAHRTTKNQFDTFQKSHQHVARTVTTQDSRIVELEAAKAQDKKRLSQLEAQFRDQLTERNNLLLVLWTRLSSLCGTDWAHDNSLINGRALPSLEAVATMLPGFSKNLLAAVKTIETMMGAFETKIKSVERDLWREYHALEGNLDTRTKKLDRLETLVRNGLATGALGDAQMQARLTRLADACRQLQVENQTLRNAADARARAAYAATGDPNGGEMDGHAGGSPSPSVPTGPRDRSRSGAPQSRIPKSGSRSGLLSTAAGGISRAGTMTRSGTSPRRPETASAGVGTDTADMSLAETEEQLDEKQQQQAQMPPGTSGGGSGGTMDNKWMLRLRDLEYKLKAEREARILDRDEARKRINASEGENLMLRENLERVEREKRRSGR